MFSHVCRSFGAPSFCGTSSSRDDLHGHATVISVAPVGRSSARCGIPTRWFTTTLGSCCQEFPHVHFSGRWVGHDGPILWPLRSPIVMLLDLFLWGYGKDMFVKPLWPLTMN
jgi:hypothetical protein